MKIVVKDTLRDIILVCDKCRNRIDKDTKIAVIIDPYERSAEILHNNCLED
jgi:hypothetical protein